MGLVYSSPGWEIPKLQLKMYPFPPFLPVLSAFFQHHDQEGSEKKGRELLLWVSSSDPTSSEPTVTHLA